MEGRLVVKRSKIVVGALALLPAVGLLTWTQLADAHYPGIEGTALCLDTNAKVTIFGESWVTEDTPRRANNNIEVLWDGVRVANQSFTAANSYRFTIDLIVPADGKTHTLKAVAVTPFGPNGEYGFAETSRESTVTLPESCVPATTLPASTSTSTTTAPPKVETAVLGATVSRPADVATPVEVLPRFAG